MAEHRERLLKLTQEKKSHKRLVKPHQATRMGSVSELVKEGSSGSSGIHDADHQAVVLSKKRSHPEGGAADVTGGGATAQAFNLSPCFV